MNIEDTLPHNIPAEMATLGACLIDPDCPVLETLTPDQFYAERHRFIFQAMTRLRQAGTAIDFVTLTDALEQDGVLAEIGGAAYAEPTSATSSNSARTRTRPTAKTLR